MSKENQTISPFFTILSFPQQTPNPLLFPHSEAVSYDCTRNAQRESLRVFTLVFMTNNEELPWCDLQFKSCQCSPISQFWFQLLRADFPFRLDGSWLCFYFECFNQRKVIVLTEMRLLFWIVYAPLPSIEQVEHHLLSQRSQDKTACDDDICPRLSLMLLQKVAALMTHFLPPSFPLARDKGGRRGGAVWGNGIFAD